MHSIIALLASLPSAKAISRKRTPLTSVSSVFIAEWDELYEATCWCVAQRTREGLDFRCRVDAPLEVAIFFFDDETHATDFKLRFG